jgi:hypothetical protein
MDFCQRKPTRSKRKLLAQILKLSNTVEAERGILSESYPLIREDCEKITSCRTLLMQTSP